MRRNLKISGIRTAQMTIGTNVCMHNNLLGMNLVRHCDDHRKDLIEMLLNMIIEDFFMFVNERPCTIYVVDELSNDCFQKHLILL